LVLVAESVAADDDRLGPARHQARHVRADDRLAEDHAAQNVAASAVRRLPHLLQAEFGDARLVRRAGGAFHADAVLLDGVGRVDRDLIVGGVTAFHAEVVIVEFEVQVREDQLVLDHLPDDPGHFVAVDVHDGVGDLDLGHAYASVSQIREGIQCRGYGGPPARAQRGRKPQRSHTRAGTKRRLGRLASSRLRLNAVGRSQRMESLMSPRRLRFVALALLPLAMAACKGQEAAAPPEAPAVQPPAAAAPAVVPAAQNDAHPPSVTREFRDWTATCDNTNHCVAFGSAEENMGFVMVSLAPGPDARPVVHMGGWGLEAGQGDVYAEIDGRRYAGKNSKMDEEGDVIAFRTPSAELLRDLGNGSFMALRRGDEKMKVSLGGAAAAFLWIDERQGRLGTTTALIRRGDRSASSVPAAPAAP